MLILDTFSFFLFFLTVGFVSIFFSPFFSFLFHYLLFLVPPCKHVVYVRPPPRFFFVGVFFFPVDPMLCQRLQYLDTKEKMRQTVVVDSVRGAAEYVTKILKVRTCVFALPVDGSGNNLSGKGRQRSITANGSNSNDTGCDHDNVIVYGGP